MPTEVQVVDFLNKHDSLRLSESPWRTHTEREDIHFVDWPRLFPSEREETSWHGDFGGDFASSVEGALAEEAPPPSDAEPNFKHDGGWDHCAWYQPIHYFGFDWGIFIREDCVRQTAIDIARHIEPSARRTLPFHDTLSRLWRAALYVYFLHEHFHHKVESLGFRIHVVDQVSAYLPYMKNVYGACIGTDDQLEEALANADAYRRLTTAPYSRLITKPIVKATREYLARRFPYDPPGYRRATQYLKLDEFESGENELQARVRDATQTPSHAAEDWDIAPRMLQSLFSVRSPIWVVVQRGSHPTSPVIPFPSCSTRDMIGLCEQFGYEVAKGGKGSHVKLKRSRSKPIILPGNRSRLSPGVVSKALSQIGGYKLADLGDLLAGRMPPLRI